jgi:iron complex transport system substrate-binding protein
MRDRFVVDDLARRVSIDVPAHRVVSLAPSCTESLHVLGALGRLVGVEEHSELSGLETLPRVGGFKHVDVDAILDLDPDLVLAAGMHAVTVVPRLAARGVRSFVAHPRTLDELVDGMARMATILGLSSAAAPFLASCRARIAAVVGRSLLGRHRPLVYVELSPDGHTGGPQSILDDLVVKAGGVNVGGVARVEWPALSEATVRRLDPDVIVVARYPGSASAPSLAERDGWDRVAAVKSGRVFEIDAGLIKRPGPGLLDGLEILARLIEMGSSTGPHTATLGGSMAGPPRPSRWASSDERC